jgi:hypothetical protein
MRRSAVILVLLVALLGPVTPSHAGLGWGTFTDEVVVQNDIVESDTSDTPSVFLLLWTALPPILL